MEAPLNWQPAAGTSLMANYAVLYIDSGFDEKRYSPSQQYGLHVMHPFPGRIEMTLSHYWVPSFKPMGQGRDSELPDFKRLHACLAKRFKMDGMRGQLALNWHSLAGSYLEFSDDGVSKGAPANLFDTRAYLHFQMDF